MKTNNDLGIFERNFAKKNRNSRIPQNNLCVIYTRVSTKGQEDNTSLASQLKFCKEYAERNKFIMVECFGGKSESASTEERKEFKRMLEFVRRRKISNILVYKVDRFSRSGAGGISLAEELKSKGHIIHSVTQPGDSTTPVGGLNQNLQFLFSNYEKEVIKERCQNGIRDHLGAGYWVGSCPFGYTQVGFKKNQKYIINEEGKILKKAFYWKAEGRSSAEILCMLKNLGMKLYAQHLSRIFRNPFYCGLVTHTALNGEIKEGNHPALVSREVFLRANEVLQHNPQGYKQSQDEEHLSNIPLKNFVKCAKCGVPYTGYLVKKKGLFYYKCNGKGCACNRSAKVMNEMFENMLMDYTLRPDLAEPLKFALEHYLEVLTKEKTENHELLQKQLKEVEKKIDTIEERFVLAEITGEMYLKFIPKYKEEKEQILQQLGNHAHNLSNLKNNLNKIAESASNILGMWQIGNYTSKKRLQYLVFPEGIHYNRENDNYRTDRVNSVFMLSRLVSENYKDKKMGTKDLIACLSPSVARRGIEPLLPG